MGGAELTAAPRGVRPRPGSQRPRRGSRPRGAPDGRPSRRRDPSKQRCRGPRPRPPARPSAGSDRPWCATGGTAQRADPRSGGAGADPRAGRTRTMSPMRGLRTDRCSTVTPEPSGSASPMQEPVTISRTRRKIARHSSKSRTAVSLWRTTSAGLVGCARLQSISEPSPRLTALWIHLIMICQLRVSTIKIDLNIAHEVIGLNVVRSTCSRSRVRGTIHRNEDQYPQIKP